MTIQLLEINQVRNLSKVRMAPGTINIIHGANGSGKTSLLESIHLLGMGARFGHRVSSM